MKSLPIFALFLTVSFTCLAQAEVSVITHPSNSSSLSKADITALFLGKKKTFPNGSSAVPLVLNDATTDEFNTKLLGKSSSQLKSYWSKLVFTGKANPPKSVSPATMLELIKGNPNMIGFVDSSTVPDGVAVAGKF